MRLLIRLLIIVVALRVLPLEEGRFFDIFGINEVETTHNIVLEK
jgi:hypothetical protein